VLKLVLHDHAYDETVCEERITVAQLELRQDLQDGRPHLRDVTARVSGRQKRQVGALVARMSERVLELIGLRPDWFSSADAPQQPELLEVSDVREVPDERGLQWGDGLRQLRVGERREQRCVRDRACPSAEARSVGDTELSQTAEDE
jgi:hypothetical protein